MLLARHARSDNRVGSVAVPSLPRCGRTASGQSTHTSPCFTLRCIRYRGQPPCTAIRSRGVVVDDSSSFFRRPRASLPTFASWTRKPARDALRPPSQASTSHPALPAILINNPSSRSGATYISLSILLRLAHARHDMLNAPSHWWQAIKAARWQASFTNALEVGHLSTEALVNSCPEGHATFVTSVLAQELRSAVVNGSGSTTITTVQLMGMRKEHTVFAGIMRAFTML